MFLEARAVIVRRSSDRGGANHGWLNTKHTFSFANYYDTKFNSYGKLRVINEDHVIPGKGFPTHPHRDFEIFSYVIKGGIRHKDSMGNVEICLPGDIQFTSAGKGIFHSEFSEPQHGPLHFLQIWISPNETGLTPSYQTKHFSDEDKLGKLCLCVSGTGENNSIQINQDVKFYASKLNIGDSVSYELKKGRKGYLHNIETSSNLKIISSEEDYELLPGDGAFLNSGSCTFESTKDLAHFVFFDLKE